MEHKSLKEIADYLRKKADEIAEPYLLEALKLIQAGEILDPKSKDKNEQRSNRNLQNN